MKYPKDRLVFFYYDGENKVWSLNTHKEYTKAEKKRIRDEFESLAKDGQVISLSDMMIVHGF